MICGLSAARAAPVRPSRYDGPIARNETGRLAPGADTGTESMAGSVNKVILIGNVGADPEIRRTQDGRAIASIRLASFDPATGEPADGEEDSSGFGPGEGRSGPEILRERLASVALHCGRSGPLTDGDAATLWHGSCISKISGSSYSPRSSTGLARSS